jgi:hypothetical protein
LYELAAPHFHGAADVLRKWEPSSYELKDILGMLFEVNSSMVGAFTLCVPPWVSSVPQANAGIVPQLGDNCFLPNLFQFFIHPLSYYLRPCSYLLMVFTSCHAMQLVA